MLIGSILNQALGQKGQRGGQHPAAPPKRAAIHVAQPINLFLFHAP